VDFVLPGHQAGFPNVKAGFFVDFSNSAVQIILVLVDLASGEAPVGALLPSLDEHGGIHGLVQQDGAPDRDTCLVLEKLFERAHMVFDREGGEQGAVLEDAQTEVAQRHGRESRVQRTDKIFVEPLCFLYLETDARN